MFKPQQQQQQQQRLLLHETPQVFGKPWYWHRSSTNMDSTRSLAQVILEMRSEIQKLEAENRELKGDNGAKTGEGSSGVEEGPTINLRRNVSAPVLESKYTENTVMTVRRYSISSNLSGVILRDGKTDRGRRADSGWGRLQDELHHSRVFDSTSRGEVGKVTNRHSLQEYVHKNRSKVKTVTFLLPVDDIYTSRPVLPKHQDEPRDTQLASISEN